MHRVIETGTRHLTCTQSCQMHLIAQDGAVVAISKKFPRPIRSNM